MVSFVSQLSGQMVGLLSRSAKSVPGRLVPADFGCVLMRSSSACATEGALWYVDEQSSMHDDVQLRESAEATAVLRSQHTEAGLVNKRLTEQVAEICAGPMHGLAPLSLDVYTSNRHLTSHCMGQAVGPHGRCMLQKPPVSLFWLCMIGVGVCSCVIQ